MARDTHLPTTEGIVMSVCMRCLLVLLPFLSAGVSAEGVITAPTLSAAHGPKEGEKIVSLGQPITATIDGLDAWRKQSGNAETKLVLYLNGHPVAIGTRPG